MNIYQKTALKAYAKGDYMQMADDPEVTPETDFGDLLLNFILRELSDDGDDEPLDRATAQDRMDAAITDIQAVLKALYAPLEETPQ